MVWDSVINKLPSSFTDMLDSPATVDEVALRGAGPITIDDRLSLDMTMSAREPSTEVPEPLQIYVNSIKYSIVSKMADLAVNTVYVNWGASRIRFHSSDQGKQVTKLEYQHWGTQNRAKHMVDAYDAIKDISAVGKPLFDALAANPKLQIKLSAVSLTALNTTYPPKDYTGVDAYVNGFRYYSNGQSWLLYENVLSEQQLPAVLSVDPAHGTTGVVNTKNPGVTFTQNMSPADLASSNVRILDKDGVALTVTKTYQDKNGNAVTYSATAPNIRKVIMNPTDADLTAARSPYTIEVQPCENIVGVAMGATYTSQFSLANDMLPTSAVIGVPIATVYGNSLVIEMTTAGTDYEGSVVYDVYLRDVSGTCPKYGNTFTLATDEQDNPYSGKIATDFPLTINDLTISTNYEVMVKTRDNAGQTVNSNVVSINTPADAAPAAPASVNVTGISTAGCTVTVGGSQPADPDDPSATITFDVYIDANTTPYGNYTWAQVSAGIGIVGQAWVAGTSHTVSVKTKAVGDTTQYSGPTTSSGFTIPADASPGNVASITVSGMSTSGCTVSAGGSQPTDSDDPGATITFDLYLDASGTPYGNYTWSQISLGVTVSGQSWAIDSSHTVKIVTKAVGDTTQYSTGTTSSQFTIPSHQVPTTPTAAVRRATNTSMVISASAASTLYDGATLAGYNIYRGGTKINGASPVSLPYTDSGLTKGVSYSYQIETVDSQGGVSAKSTAVALTAGLWLAPYVQGATTGDTAVSVSGGLLNMTVKSTTGGSNAVNNIRTKDSFNTAAKKYWFEVEMEERTSLTSDTIRLSLETTNSPGCSILINHFSASYNVATYENSTYVGKYTGTAATTGTRVKWKIGIQGKTVEVYRNDVLVGTITTVNDVGTVIPILLMETTSTAGHTRTFDNFKVYDSDGVTVLMSDDFTSQGW